jgi:hypothetical protein
MSEFISSWFFYVCREDPAWAPLAGSAAPGPAGVRGRRQDAVAARPPADAHPASGHVLPPFAVRVSVISHTLCIYCIMSVPP